MRHKIIQDLPFLLRKQGSLSYENNTFENISTMTEAYVLFQDLIKSQEQEQPSSSEDIISPIDSTKRHIKTKPKSTKLQQFRQYTDL